jgi:hypothetical protein
LEDGGKGGGCTAKLEEPKKRNRGERGWGKDSKPGPTGRRDKEDAG